MPENDGQWYFRHLLRAKVPCVIMRTPTSLNLEWVINFSTLKDTVKLRERRTHRHIERRASIYRTAFNVSLCPSLIEFYGYMRCHEGSLVFDLDLDSSSSTDFISVALCIFESVVWHWDVIHSYGRGGKHIKPQEDKRCVVRPNVFRLTMKPKRKGYGLLG